MAGNKKYQIYVKPGARKSLAVRTAVNQLNKTLGKGKTVSIVTNKRAADAVIGYGLGGTKNSGMTRTSGKKDHIQINKAAKALPKSAYRRTIEHEIGHGLGLNHRPGPQNLMNPKTGGRSLKAGQKKKVRRTKRKGGYS